METSLRAGRRILLVCGLLMAAPARTGEATSRTDQRLAAWLKRFPRADANGDGVLTAAEVAAFRQTSRPADDRSRQPGASRQLIPTVVDARYGSHPRNLLDVYKARANAPTPVLIFFHGGGFVAGDKSAGARFPLSRRCLQAGITVVSANYRFVKTDKDGNPGEPHPAPVLDGARAVQFVRSKAKEWNIDPKRVALSGGSAGAVMAMWIGFHDDLADPDGDAVTRQSTRVTCLVPNNGPTSLEPSVILEYIGGNPEIHPSLLPFYGAADMMELARPDKQALAKDASVMTHVSADDPPVYAVYGGTLKGVPLPANAPFGASIHHAMFGKLLKARCDAVGVDCIFTCRDVRAAIDDIGFLKQQFGMD